MEYKEAMEVLREMCNEYYKYGCDVCPMKICKIPKLADFDRTVKIIEQYKAEKAQLKFELKKKNIVIRR